MFVFFKLLYYQNINEFEADYRVELEMWACWDLALARAFS